MFPSTRRGKTKTNTLATECAFILLGHPQKAPFMAHPCVCPPTGKVAETHGLGCILRGLQVLQTQEATG